jgi:hypothetical protein
MMHGQPNIKICIAKQAKQIFQLKKIKIKLYKNNVAIWYKKTCRINTLSPELNPICYLLALLAHDFLHVSRIRVKSLMLRLLMPYIY